MFLSRASLRCARSAFVRPGHIDTVRGSSSYLASPVSFRGARWRLSPTTALRSRMQSTASDERLRITRKSQYAYPEVIHIYDSGLTPQLFIGSFRLISLVVFVAGTFVLAPMYIFDGTAPAWLVPAVVVGSAAPLATSILAFGPFIHHIKVVLPSSARRSREALMRFAARTPPATRLQIQCQRFAPWPRTHELAFDELARLPSSWRSLANLEWRPWRNADATTRKGIGAWFVRHYFGRFFVNRSLVKDRSRVPGVWDAMWEQIPMVGEETAGAGRSAGIAVEKVAMERVSVKGSAETASLEKAPVRNNVNRAAKISSGSNRRPPPPLQTRQR